MSMFVSADLIIENVTVMTMDPLFPTARGIAVADGKIVGLLHSDQDNWPLAPHGKRLDGGGMFILPGLIDAHCHLRAEISKSLSVSCGKEDVTSISDLIAAIQSRANQTPQNEWVRATGYNPFYLKENRHPTCGELDAATVHHPVRLRHVTRHASVLNSFALRLAGIDRYSTDPPGVTVERDSLTNEPTGVIYGGDNWLSQHVISPHKTHEWQAGVSRLQTFLLSCGITALIDATPTNTKNDVQFWLSQIENGWPIMLQFMCNENIHDELFHFLKNEVPDPLRKQLEIGAIKVVMEANPELYPELDELVRIAVIAARKDASLAIHVVDPEMTWTAIQAVKHATEVFPKSRSIYRFEHLSLCPEAFLDDLKDLNIISVTNPSFIREHGDRYLSKVDPSEQTWLYRMKSLVDKGIPLAAGSDAPVASFNPWEAISTAVSRTTIRGEAVGQSERLSPFQAIQMYTMGAAESAGWKHCRGMIRPGFQADFIVLPCDPLNCSLEQLQDMRAYQTWIGGTLVYQAH